MLLQNTKLSCASDGRSAKLNKSMINSINCYSIGKKLQRSVLAAYFLMFLKLLVLPVFKLGNKNNVKTYRPLYLIPALSDILKN